MDSPKKKKKRGKIGYPKGRPRTEASRAYTIKNIIPQEAKYSIDLCEKILPHFREAGTLQTLPGYLFDQHGLSITRTSLYRWIDKYPEFAQAVELGRALGERFLEKLLMADIVGQGIKGRKIGSQSLCWALSRYARCHSDRDDKQAKLENLLTLSREDVENSKAIQAEARTLPAEADDEAT